MERRGKCAVGQYVYFLQYLKRNRFDIDRKECFTHTRREINEHVSRWEVLCGVDLALQSDVLVVGAESSRGYPKAVDRVRVVVVGVDAASVWLVGDVDDLDLIPATSILLGSRFY